MKENSFDSSPMNNEKKQGSALKVPKTLAHVKPVKKIVSKKIVKNDKVYTRQVEVSYPPAPPRDISRDEYKKMQQKQQKKSDIKVSKKITEDIVELQSKEDGTKSDINDDFIDSQKDDYTKSVSLNSSGSDINQDEMLVGENSDDDNLSQLPSRVANIKVVKKLDRQSFPLKEDILQHLTIEEQKEIRDSIKALTLHKEV